MEGSLGRWLSLFVVNTANGGRTYQRLGGQTRGGPKMVKMDRSQGIAASPLLGASEPGAGWDGVEGREDGPWRGPLQVSEHRGTFVQVRQSVVAAWLLGISKGRGCPECECECECVGG